MAEATFRCPSRSEEHKPKEKTTLVGRSDLPEKLGARDGGLAMEEG
jgi:hypothetical protein